MTKLNKDQIRELLPHREPMLLIDELVDIKKLHSATAIMHVKKDAFFVDGHFVRSYLLYLLYVLIFLKSYFHLFYVFDYI